MDMRRELFRRRIGVGCFAMLLIPAGAAYAQGAVDPGVDVCAVGGSVRAGAVEGARLFGEPSRLPEPWFRRTFVVARTDGTCAVKPVEHGVTRQRAVKAAPVVPEVQRPGVVQNVRRTDRR
jgi:hypothetical protein